MGVSRSLGLLVAGLVLGTGCQCFVPVDEDAGELEPWAVLPRSDAGTASPDAGLADSGAWDAGTPDSGVVVSDAGEPDAGAPDGGTPDAGELDGGEPDAGTPDAGAPDGGMPDSGALDSGVTDAGWPDAGVPDAGSLDAGLTPLGSYDLDFSCISSCTGNFRHRLVISAWDPATGFMSGSGYYAGDPRYTWTMAGRSSPPMVQMTLTYTGLNPGYQTAMMGMTDQDGAPAAGTATTTQAQTLTWVTTRLP